MLKVGLPYIAHTNFSSSNAALSLTIFACVPTCRNAWTALWLLRHSFSGPFFPFLTKALVQSLPVNAWNAGSAQATSRPNAAACLCTSSKLRLFPHLVSNVSGCWMKTSVSGNLTTTATSVGICWELYRQCRMILVSASSWFDDNSTAPEQLMRSLSSPLCYACKCIAIPIRSTGCVVVIVVYSNRFAILRASRSVGVCSRSCEGTSWSHMATLSSCHQLLYAVLQVCVCNKVNCVWLWQAGKNQPSQVLEGLW